MCPILPPPQTTEQSKTVRHGTTTQQPKNTDPGERPADAVLGALHHRILEVIQHSQAEDTHAQDLTHMVKWSNLVLHGWRDFTQATWLQRQGGPGRKEATD